MRRFLNVSMRVGTVRENAGCLIVATLMALGVAGLLLIDRIYSLP
jgi:hypothetical protein